MDISSFVHHKNNNDNDHTFTNILYKLWDKMSDLFLKKKSEDTVGRPVTHYRKVMNSIPHVLRTGCQWLMMLSY